MKKFFDYLKKKIGRLYQKDSLSFEIDCEKIGENLSQYHLNTKFFDENHLNIASHPKRNDIWLDHFNESIIPMLKLNQKFEVAEYNKAFLEQIKQKIGNNNELFLENIYLTEDESERLRSQLKSNSVNILSEILYKKLLGKSFKLNISFKNYNQENNCFVGYFNFLSDIENSECIIVSLFDNYKEKKLEMSFAHSQKMQAVGQLAGGIAHDFNNLLTAILGFSELLLIKHPAGDPSFPEVIQIKQNAVRASNLVKQLLAFSRKQILEVKFLNINDILFNIADLLRRLIGENIELNLQLDHKLGYIKVDQGQFEQVITNLIINARDAINENILNGQCVKGEIEISTKFFLLEKSYLNYFEGKKIINVDDDSLMPGNYMMLRIKDNGNGISQNNLSKIFEPFFSTKQNANGTGLGLSMVYGIVKQSGGHIFFSTEVGQGSIFYIMLRSYKENETYKIENNLSNPEQIDNRKYTEQVIDLTGDNVILLVEDEDPVRIFINTALSNKGYEIYSAKNAEQALQMVSELDKPIDLVITDVIMPGMNGYDMVQILAKKFENLKIIFISGYTEDHVLTQMSSLPAKNYIFLSKPFNLRQIVASVKNILSNKID